MHMSASLPNPAGVPVLPPSHLLHLWFFSNFPLSPPFLSGFLSAPQGDSDSSSPGAISMALSEPLGSGLFVGNIVFALVVFFSGLQEVRVGF